ncbi:MAG TPA: hypothetical protein VJV78_44210 [Polyangiales bacterium]|nr:hypothetical protein [Polyangiales bacterium]
MLNGSTMVMIAGLVLVATTACLLSASVNDPVDKLSAQLRTLRVLLYTSSAALTCGVLEVYTFHRMPAALLSDLKVAKQMHSGRSRPQHDLQPVRHTHAMSLHSATG